MKRKACISNTSELVWVIAVLGTHNCFLQFTLVLVPPHNGSQSNLVSFVCLVQCRHNDPLVSQRGVHALRRAAAAGPAVLGQFGSWMLHCPEFLQYMSKAESNTGPWYKLSVIGKLALNHCSTWGSCPIWLNILLQTVVEAGKSNAELNKKPKGGKINLRMNIGQANFHDIRISESSTKKAPLLNFTEWQWKYDFHVLVLPRQGVEHVSLLEQTKLGKVLVDLGTDLVGDSMAIALVAKDLLHKLRQFLAGHTMKERNLVNQQRFCYGVWRPQAHTRPHVQAWHIGRDLAIVEPQCWLTARSVSGFIFQVSWFLENTEKMKAS